MLRPASLFKVGMYVTGCLTLQSNGVSDATDPYFGSRFVVAIAVE